MYKLKIFQSEIIKYNKETTKVTGLIHKKTEKIKEERERYERLDEIMNRVLEWINSNNIVDFKITTSTLNFKPYSIGNISYDEAKYIHKFEFISLEVSVFIFYRSPIKDLIK